MAVVEAARVHHAEVAHREIVADGIHRIDSPERRGDVTGHSPARAGVVRQAEAAADANDVRIERNHQLRRGNSRPETEVERVITGKADLAYTLSFEVLPPITLGDFGSITLERPVAEVADEEIDAAVRQIAESNRSYAAKGEGDAPVQAYIAGLPGWKGALGKRLDALIVRSVPRAKKAVKWNSPFYGLEGKGWFLSMHAFAKYMKLAFFRGTSLKPQPPGASKSKDVRYLDIREEDELDEAQLTKWLKQAAKLPGWNP